jgi:hypothetical protein
MHNRKLRRSDFPGKVRVDSAEILIVEGEDLIDVCFPGGVQM